MHKVLHLTSAEAVDKGEVPKMGRHCTADCQPSIKNLTANQPGDGVERNVKGYRVFLKLLIKRKPRGAKENGIHKHDPCRS